MSHMRLQGALPRGGVGRARLDGRGGGDHTTGMGYDVLALVTFAIAATLSVFGFAAMYRMRERDREVYESVWAAYARQHGALFEPSSGAWPVRTPARVVADRAGEAFVVDAVFDDERIYTRVSLKPKNAFVAKLVIVPSRAGAGGGDPSPLARGLRIVAHPPSFAERFVDDGILRRLSAFRIDGFTRLGYERGKLSLVWPGGEVNPARLDAALTVLERIEAEMNSAFVRAA